MYLFEASFIESENAESSKEVVFPIEVCCNYFDSTTVRKNR